MNSRQKGFTLLELIIGLTLMALVAGVLFGAFGLSTRSWDAGEERSARSDQMRIAESFLRAQLTLAFPFRFKKVENPPIAFYGEADSLRYAAPLVSRIGQGGLFWLQLSLQDTNNTRRLILQRVIPDSDATSFPNFNEDDLTILAKNIAEVKFSYFGPPSDPDGGLKQADAAWLDQWTSRRSMPILIKLQITPKEGLPWPDLIVEPMVGNNAACIWDSFHNRCVYL